MVIMQAKMTNIQLPDGRTNERINRWTKSWEKENYGKVTLKPRLVIFKAAAQKRRSLMSK